MTTITLKLRSIRGKERFVFATDADSDFNGKVDGIVLEDVDVSNAQITTTEALEMAYSRQLGHAAAYPIEAAWIVYNDHKSRSK